MLKTTKLLKEKIGRKVIINILILSIILIFGSINPYTVQEYMIILLIGIGIYIISLIHSVSIRFDNGGFSYKRSYFESFSEYYSYDKIIHIEKTFLWYFIQLPQETIIKVPIFFFAKEELQEFIDLIEN